MKVLIAEKLSQHRYKTPEGYLICVDSVLARTGKQTYRRNEIFTDSEDDRLIEVDRKAEEVFSPETMASFENKPICVEHPDVDVTVDNISEFAVGFVRDIHKGEYEGEPVMLGTLVITDAKTIEEIENGEHTDLSCGYDCDIEDCDSPEQKHIRGNHIALCEHGRAGIAHIVDSVNDEARLIKGLVFETKEKISANSTLSLNEGIYKIGFNTYVLIFYSGTHQSKEMQLESKYNARIIEAFATSFINGYVDIGDLKKLKTGNLGTRLIELAKRYYNTNNVRDKLVESSSKEAFNKNVATEIKAGKDPKQAVAIAYSVQRKNDEESTYTEVTKNLEKEADKDMKWLDTVIGEKKEEITDASNDFQDTPRNRRLMFEFAEKNGNIINTTHDKKRILEYIERETGIKNANYHQVLYILANYTRTKLYDEEIKDYVPFPAKDDLTRMKITKEQALSFISMMLKDKENTVEDSEGMIYLTQKAYNDIKAMVKNYGITQKELEGISRYFFGPGGYNMFR